MIDNLEKIYPYLTYIKTDKFGTEIIGVMQKVTAKFVWIYDYDLIEDEDARKRILEYAQKWYYESNMEITIEMFIGRAFDEFTPYLRGFSVKDISEIVGPQVNLGETFRRRTKKRTIHLVREMD
jgi:hypothetical protein